VEEDIMLNRYLRREYSTFFYFIISYLLFAVFPIHGQPVTDTIGKLYHKGSPLNLSNDTIPVTDKIVALAEEIKLKKVGWELYSPSIFFVIDHSASMFSDCGECKRDFLGHRFTVTQDIIKTLKADSMFAGVEIGIAVFALGLYYENEEDPLVLDSLPDSLNTGESKPQTAWLQSGGYLPLYKLGTEYETKDGKKKGGDLLIEYLEVAKKGNFIEPVKPNDVTGGHNTNISIGFRAAINAMKASKAAKDDQYIIFISDGEATHGSNDFEQGYIEDVDLSDRHLIPTTFTIFFEMRKGQHHPSLDLMNENIKNNGYSESNAKYTNLWDYNNNTKEDLYNFINDSIISVIIKKKLWKKLEVKAINASADYDEKEEKFLLPSVIPLAGKTTPMNYDIHYVIDTANNQTPSSAIEIKPIEFKVDIDENLSELDSMFYAHYWIRTLGFYDKNGKGLDLVKGEIDECVLKFSNNPFTAKYEYKKDIKIEIRSEKGKDIEVFTLNKDDFQKYSLKIKPKKVSGNVTSKNGTIEYMANDKLFATFRNSENPKLDLDTLVSAVSLKKKLVMVNGIYFDNNADGRIDSIFIEMLEAYDFTNDDLDRIKENIQLPDHRKFSIEKVNFLDKGVGFNVLQNSPVNTAVTDKDKLVIKKEIELFNGTVDKGEAGIIDSVAPVIMSAKLVDYGKPGKEDILTITLSENVKKITTKNPFLLYSVKENKVYNATLSTQSQNGENAVFTVLSLGDNIKKVGTGDSINIHKDGKVFDLIANQQDNPDNIRREIEIHRILELKEGIYFDNNADGRIDSIFVGIFGEYDFTDDDLALLRAKVKLPDHRKFTIKKANALNNGFSFNVSQNSSAEINTAVTNADKLAIDIDIELAVNGTLSKSSAAIIDSMAPVIMRAQLVDYMKPEKEDQLTIIFSERIDSITTEKPFLFYSNNGEKVYDASLQILNHNGETSIFKVVSLSDNMYRIGIGDSINIFKDGKVIDPFGNQQDNPDNIRRIVEIERVPDPYRVEVKSTLKTINDQHMVIQVRPRGLDYTTEFDSLSAEFDIYDPVGNIVQKDLKMNFHRKNGNMYLQYDWDCRNLIRREVGRGSYLGLFHITSYFIKDDGVVIPLTNYDTKLKYLAVQD
jgi:hypothetical protein